MYMNLLNYGTNISLTLSCTCINVRMVSAYAFEHQALLPSCLTPNQSITKSAVCPPKMS